MRASLAATAVTGALLVALVAVPAAAQQFRLGGYVKGQYMHTDEGAPQDKLDITMLRPWVKGQLGDDVALFAMYHLSTAGSGMLLDSWLAWKDPWAQSQLRGGQFQVPVGFENPLSSSKLDFITRSYVTTGVFPGSYDTGLTVDGVLGHMNGELPLHYVLSSLSGKGRGNWDFGWKRDTSLVIGLPLAKGSEFQGSYYWGVRRHDLGFGLKWQDEKWRVQGEWFNGAAGALAHDGWYLLGRYDLTPKQYVAARFEEYDPDHATVAGARERWTLGYGIFPAKSIRVLANLELRDGPAAFANDRFGVEAQYVW